MNIKSMPLDHTAIRYKNVPFAVAIGDDI